MFGNFEEEEMKTGIATVATGLALGLATQAGAAVIYGTQTRTLDAHYTVFAGAPSTASAPDFNTFNQSVSASNPPQLTGSATASQNSSLTQSAMTNVSHVTGHGGNQTSRGVGTSSFAVTFSVDTPTPWTIGGNWSFNTSNGLTGPANGTMNLLLQQQGGPMRRNSR
jgi:creatinine amidohydrolase/Fe(II)-dependent formamide hydrolase-like protein